MYKLWKDDIKYYDDAEVTLIASTQTNNDQINAYMIEYDLSLDRSEDELARAEFLPEFAGRHCYMAFGKSAKSKSNKEYLTNIINHRHYSVLEHLSYTFLIRGASRGFTHEICRHRHLSPSQFSTRYCKSKDYAFVVPVLLRDDSWEIEFYLNHCKNCLTQYNLAYSRSYAKECDKLGEGIDRPVHLLLKKKARSVARSYLPIGVEAPIILSGNLRTWRELILKRLSPFAELEIQDVCNKICDKLKKVIKNGMANLNQ